MSKHRILVIAHAHPDFSLGGGEIAAYNLFKAYKRHENVEDAWFLGRSEGGRGVIINHKENEYLWEQNVPDFFRMKAANTFALMHWFSDLIKMLKPTIVHIHHYVHLGLEFMRLIKQINPDVKMVFTLHEYIAICHNNGQMIKTGDDFRLCHQSSFEECRRCFPERTVEDFWLRKHYFMKHFEVIDEFVSPSHFLKERYVAWGLPADKITVIENGQTDELALTPRLLAKNEKRNKFGYFGQINQFKGLVVVLQAIAQMTPAQKSQMLLEIHGANLQHQSQKFQDKVKQLLEPLVEEGVVQWIGPYQPDELRGRMEMVDWVVVPSIWWENSPMVIQEAFANGRPILVSNIGGMKEKIRDGVDGFHVVAGNVSSWISTFDRCANLTVAQWNQMQSNIKKPLTYLECANEHLKLQAFV